MSTRVVGIAMAAAFAVAAIGTPVAAEKTYYDLEWDDLCGGEVTKHWQGWIDHEKPFRPFGGWRNHAVQWYSNDDGDTCCRYVDTGIIKWADADGNDQNEVVSGRTVTIIDDDIGRAGRTFGEDGEVKHRGKVFGHLDDMACGELTD